MPKELEQKLMKSAHKRGLSGKRANAYVYGTMNKMGMMGEHITSKGVKEKSPCRFLMREGKM